MQFGKSGDPERPFRITFEGDEVDVVRAAYRELIHNLASRGNTGSISEYETVVAGWEEGGDRAVIIQNFVDITERLDEFHENTDEAIAEITEVTAVPAYANEHIHKRYMLGKMALQLADDVRAAATLEVNTDGLEGELAQLVEDQNNTGS